MMRMQRAKISNAFSYLLPHMDVYWTSQPQEQHFYKLLPKCPFLNLLTFGPLIRKVICRTINRPILQLTNGILCCLCVWQNNKYQEVVYLRFQFDVGLLWSEVYHLIEEATETPKYGLTSKPPFSCWEDFLDSLGEFMRWKKLLKDTVSIAYREWYIMHNCPWY